MGSAYSSTSVKVALRGAIERMILLTNKKQVHVRAARKELASLLAAGKEDTARIRVEALIAEDNLLVVFEPLSLYCELMVIRLGLLDTEESRPTDMEEAIATIIYGIYIKSDIYGAAKRLDVKEFVDIANQFAMKYGKEFAQRHHSNASGKVNPRVVEMLSVQPPGVSRVIDTLVEIAADYQLKWKPSPPTVKANVVQEAPSAPIMSTQGNITNLSSSSIPVTPGGGVALYPVTISTTSSSAIVDSSNQPGFTPSLYAPDIMNVNTMTTNNVSTGSVLPPTLSNMAASLPHVDIRRDLPPPPSFYAPEYLPQVPTTQLPVNPAVASGSPSPSGDTTRIDANGEVVVVRPQSLQKSKQSRKSSNGDTIDNDETDAEMAELTARFSNLKKR